MQHCQSPQAFTSEAVRIFETALQEFHQEACSGAQQLANSSQVVTMKVVQQAIVETCLAMADRYSSAGESSGEKQVA